MVLKLGFMARFVGSCILIIKIMVGMIFLCAKEVWETYGGFTANQLERLAHSEIPWIEVRKNVDIDESSDRKINIKTIYDYYLKQLVNE